jgi:hypothetical protein
MSQPATKCLGIQPSNEHDISEEVLERMGASFMRPVEEICSAMSANGALVALRDKEGLRCVASVGDAPTVGSRLQTHSTFTIGCLESGEVTICEDTEKDSRIHPTVAKSLNLRSAVAVPIHTKGTVVGVIEVFSSRPSHIYAADVAVLKQFGDFFAHMIVSGPPTVAQIIERGTPHFLPRAEGLAARCAEDTEGAAEKIITRFRGAYNMSDQVGSPVPGSACSTIHGKLKRQKENAQATRRWLRIALRNVFASRDKG